MGKRELLLILGFLIAGVVIYRATAPPSPEGESGFPVGRLLDEVRREIRGNQASAEAERAATHQVPPEVTEVWIRGMAGRVDEIVVRGEEREDVQTRLRVTSRAYDDAEARGTAERTVLTAEPAGATLGIGLTFPREGRQNASLTVTMPARLRLRVDARAAKLTISGVAAVETTNATGEVSVRDVPGRAAVTHRNGEVAIADVGSLKYTGRNSRLTLAGVRGETALAFEQGGGLSASRVHGPVEIEARHAEIALDGAPGAGPLRVNATGGSVRIRELQGEARLDGRDAEIDLAMRTAAPVTIYSQGEDVSVTPPAAAHRLDLVATDGRIAPDSAIEGLGLSRSAQPGEQRASGEHRGGGPTISVRATRGDVILRLPEREH